MCPSCQPCDVLGFWGTWSTSQSIKASSGHCRQLPLPSEPVHLGAGGCLLSGASLCPQHWQGAGYRPSLLSVPPSPELGGTLSGSMRTGEGPPGQQVPDLWTMGILRMPRAHGIISGGSNLAFPPVQFFQSFCLSLLRQA